MHYYQKNIGDYRRDTSHLTLLEHGVYNQLIDWYCLDEAPIPNETQSVMRRLSAKSQDEQDAVIAVLKDFFFITAHGYEHKRCNAEIEKYQAKSVVNKVNGINGGRPKKTQSVIFDNPNETQTKPKHNPNQEPRTKNQEPLTINQEPEVQNQKQVKVKISDATATRLPADWKAGEAEVAFLKTKRPELDLETIEGGFRDYWVSKSGAIAKKLDWPATWRNWVRNQKPVYQTIGGQANKKLSTHDLTGIDYGKGGKL